MLTRWKFILLATIAVLLLAPTAVHAEDITVEKVISMLDAKIEETTIIKHASMEGNTTRFDMSTENLIKLKKAGATEKLTSWMIEESTKEAREILSDVSMYLNNARNTEENDINRAARQKVLAHTAKAIPVLVKLGLKKETNPKAKYAALGVIYELLTPTYANQELTEALEQHLVADDADVRYAAARAYSVIADQASLTKCFETLTTGHPVYPDGYVMVLAYSQNGNSIPTLKGLMESSDPEVRRVAAFGIGYQHLTHKKKPDADTQTLIVNRMIAPAETTEVRIACAKALADMGSYDDTILQQVIRTAEAYSEARPSMVLRMADFDQRNYVILEYLVGTALEDRDDPRVLDAANTALHKLTKQTYNTLEQWQTWWSVQKQVLKRQAGAPGTGANPTPAPADLEHPDAPPKAVPPAGSGNATTGTVMPDPNKPPTPTPPATTTPETTPPPPAPSVAKLTDAAYKDVLTHLGKAHDLAKSSDPKEWDKILAEYDVMLKITLPLGERHNLNVQFLKEQQFAQLYKHGLELMQAKNYAAARKEFGDAAAIGFYREFTGLDDRLREIEKATAQAPAPAPAPAPTP